MQFEFVDEATSTDSLTDYYSKSEMKEPVYQRKHIITMETDDSVTIMTRMKNEQDQVQKSWSGDLGWTYLEQSDKAIVIKRKWNFRDKMLRRFKWYEAKKMFLKLSRAEKVKINE